jgi:hypothetical protein
VGLRAGEDAVKKRKITFPHRESNLGPSSPYPVATQSYPCFPLVLFVTGNECVYFNGRAIAAAKDTVYALAYFKYFPFDRR